MELTLNRINRTPPTKSKSAFIEGNTMPVTLEEIQRDHVIPVYVKTNDPAISFGEFIQTVKEAAIQCFNENNTFLDIRVSHPIKGRIPSAKLKPASELLDHEKTIYYERMGFVVEFPNFQQVVDGNLLHLTVGGVKSFSEDNFYNNKGVDEHFKIFIGFKNTVCLNLCIFSDGFTENLTARSTKELFNKSLDLFTSYNSETHISDLQDFSLLCLKESQFAQLIGRCRLYNFLSQEQKKEIPELKLNDTQLGRVAESYYNDPNFKIQGDGELNLWRLYNLLTSSNKSSYLNTFLDRGSNAHDFTKQLAEALKYKKDCWFLN